MWDEFAKGVVRAITQSGAEGIQVYSVDITDEDIQMMTEPGSPWAATVATDSYNVGRLAVRSALAKVVGEDVEKYLLVEPALITQDFLLDNNITNMDELVEVLPVLGESPLVWYDWMLDIVTENGYDLPQIAGVTEGDEASGSTAAIDLSAVQLPEVFGDDELRVALVREIGDGAFMARYLAGAQSMADELGIELIESNARGDQAQMVTMVENAIQQQVDAIIIDHGRTDTLQY
jgi:ABC-type sugar transport system substrate-binding protein